MVLTTFDSVGYEIDTGDDKDTNYRSKVSFYFFVKIIKMLSSNVIVYMYLCFVLLQKRSPLTRINWERIILDEGHVIRNPATQKAKALCKLTASHKWVVTGTPVHNK